MEDLLSGTQAECCMNTIMKTCWGEDSNKLSIKLPFWLAAKATMEVEMLLPKMQGIPQWGL